MRLTEERKADHKKAGRSLILIGLGFAFLEVLKQVYLVRNVFGGGYNVWYLPFQLCSMPIYLCPPAGVMCLLDDRLSERGRGIRSAMLTFLEDFGFLGGLMALIVRDGFTFADHPLLTAHGWIWHLGMIALSIRLSESGLTDQSIKGWLKTLPLFLILASCAETINVAFHGMGDADMFYISPYHLSSQPVFRDLDAAVGRPLGILLYLAAVMFGAFLSHILFLAAKAIRPGGSRPVK